MSLWAWRLGLGLGLLLSSLLPLPPLASGDSTYATVCGKTGKYKINSTYQENIKYVTDYLVNYPTFTAGTGFTTTSYGDAPDVVYGLGLCRGDTPDNLTCYECLSTASEMAPVLCPHDKDATLFYDGCIMRFSNQDFLGTMDNEPVVVMNETMTKPAAVASSFDALVGRLMDKTAEHAATSSIPTKKMATGEAVFDDDTGVEGDQQHTKVYSLVQCTPDLTPAGCSRCLKHVLNILALRRPGSLGERVAGVRCNLRFQVYQFYVGEAMVVLEGSDSPAPSPAPRSSRPLPQPSPRAVTPPASPPPNNKKKGTKTKIWIIAVTVPLVLLFVCIFFAFTWARSRHSNKEYVTSKDFVRNSRGFIPSGNKNSQLQEDAPRDTQGSVNMWSMEDSSTEFSTFDFSHIADATNKFSDGNKLGEGGFGRVYKGQLPNGLEIAVKRLNPHSGQGLTEFKTEIQLIAKLQHMNLVRLLGCCIQGEEKILIYEYMSNRSLDFFIFDTARGALLNWNKRRHIIEGIAQGLLYLHKHSRLRVIHRDLKASNILLDDNMSPKISDFGLARIFGSNETHANTSRVVGTHGYMAPEYASEGLFSVKSDVFSFGVLLLEIISGKRNIGFHETGNFPNLLGYAWIQWKEEKWNEVIDPCLDTSHHSMEVRRLINIALMCVQDNAVDRPNMTDIISLLMNESTSLPEPKQPAYFNIRTVNKEECVIDLEKSINSINDVTSSPPNGR